MSQMGKRERIGKEGVKTIRAKAGRLADKR